MAEKDERRLATVLAADVAGYRPLMGEDEAGTLAALKNRRREVFDTLIAKYMTRLIELIGDGLPLEFSISSHPLVDLGGNGWLSHCVLLFWRVLFAAFPWVRPTMANIV
jgi:class 3 adenylate cyclase